MVRGSFDHRRVVPTTLKPTQVNAFSRARRKKMGSDSNTKFMRQKLTDAWAHVQPRKTRTVAPGMYHEQPFLGHGLENESTLNEAHRTVFSTHPHEHEAHFPEQRKEVHINVHRGLTTLRHRNADCGTVGSCVPAANRRMDGAKEHSWLPCPYTENSIRDHYRRQRVKYAEQPSDAELSARAKGWRSGAATAGGGLFDRNIRGLALGDTSGPGIDTYTGYTPPTALKMSRTLGVDADGRRLPIVGRTDQQQPETGIGQLPSAMDSNNNNSSSSSNTASLKTKANQAARRPQQQQRVDPMRGRVAQVSTAFRHASSTDKPAFRTSCVGRSARDGYVDGSARPFSYHHTSFEVPELVRSTRRFAEGGGNGFRDNRDQALMVLRKKQADAALGRTSVAKRTTAASRARAAESAAQMAKMQALQQRPPWRAVPLRGEWNGTETNAALHSVSGATNQCLHRCQASKRG